jgi:hypothetical protein
MKSFYLLILLLITGNIGSLFMYLQSVNAQSSSEPKINRSISSVEPKINKSIAERFLLNLKKIIGERSSHAIVSLSEVIKGNRLYPTGRFQTILIVPQDTSSEISCPNLEDRSSPTIQIEKNTSQNIVLRDETKQIENAGRNTVLGDKNKNFKIISLQNDLLPGKTYSLTITDTVDLSSSTIIPFSVISKDKVNQLCSSLKEISGQINDEGTKTIKKALLYGEYNLYSYAIPELESFLSEGKTPPKYNVIVYTALALYYDEMGFLGKALEKYNKALEEANKCSEKMPCDFKITDDQNINAIKVQAFINQRLGYIYLYNRSIANEQERLAKSNEFLRNAKKLYQCQDDSKDNNCQTLNKELQLLTQLELHPPNQ